MHIINHRETIKMPRIGAINRQMIEIRGRGARVAQSVGWLALYFGSGHDLRVLGSSPTSDSVLGMEPV